MSKTQLRLLRWHLSWVKGRSPWEPPWGWRPRFRAAPLPSSCRPAWRRRWRRSRMRSSGRWPRWWRHALWVQHWGKKRRWTDRALNVWIPAVIIFIWVIWGPLSYRITMIKSNHFKTMSSLCLHFVYFPFPDFVKLINELIEWPTDKGLQNTHSF